MEEGGDWQGDSECRSLPSALLRAGVASAPRDDNFFALKRIVECPFLPGSAGAGRILSAALRLSLRHAPFVPSLRDQGRQGMGQGRL